jgi:hypothetical protein
MTSAMQTLEIYDRIADTFAVKALTSTLPPTLPPPPLSSAISGTLFLTPFNNLPLFTPEKKAEEGTAA